MMKKALLSTLFLLIFSSSSWALNVGDKAPNFTIKSDDGTVSLSDFKGDVVMVNFWASWCGPCAKEMPVLEKFYKKYNKVGFTIVGVSMDDTVKDAKKMLKKTPVSFPIGYDLEDKTVDTYEIEGTPMTYLVDREGIVRFKHIGYKSSYDKKYKKEIKTLIKE